MRDRPFPDDGEPGDPERPRLQLPPLGRGYTVGTLASGALGLVAAALGLFVALPDWTSKVGARETAADVAAISEAAEGVHVLGVFTLALGLASLIIGIFVGARARTGLRGYAVAIPGLLASAAGIALVASAR